MTLPSTTQKKYVQKCVKAKKELDINNIIITETRRQNMRMNPSITLMI